MAAVAPVTVPLSELGIVVLRTPQEGDAEATLAFLLKHLAEPDHHQLTEVDELRITVAQEADRIMACQSSQKDLLIIAETVDERGRRIVGLLDLIGGAKRRNAHTAEVGLSVSREFRGKGLGKAMLQLALEWASSTHLEKITLQVHSKNTPAIGLYESSGFQLEGRLARGVKIRDEYQDVLLYSHDLAH